jgi:hypothetical protein
MAMIASEISRRIRRMSALPPEADIARCGGHVRFVPKADILRRGKNRYFMSACSDGETFKGRAIFTVLGLMTSSNLSPVGGTYT